VRLWVTCPNLADPDQSGKILSKLIILRNNLSRAVDDSGVKNIRAIDSWLVIKFTSTANTTGRLTNRQEVTSNDGVHYTREGQMNFADNCIASLRSITKRPATASSINKHKKSCFYWHGFRSPIGAATKGAAGDARQGRRHSRLPGKLVPGNQRGGGRMMHPFHHRWALLTRNLTS
jgi:hypothetical protein